MVKNFIKIGAFYGFVGSQYNKGAGEVGGGMSGCS